jgi:hypothetical protein
MNEVFMKSFRILLMACSLLSVAPALASDIVLGLGDTINSNTMQRIRSDEQEPLYSQQEVSDDHEVVKMQSNSPRTCWQTSKPYVITGVALLALCGASVGSMIGWSEACLSLLARNGTSIWCANNSTNNTGGWMLPWGGIP